MTLLYKPVLIETAEQAEALPIGTPVLTVLTDHGEEERVVGADYIDDSFDEDLTPGGNFHHVALVPIEAEEEWKTLHEGAWHLKADEDDARRDTNSLGARRRYTTDWEEA